MGNDAHLGWPFDTECTCPSLVRKLKLGRSMLTGCPGQQSLSSFCGFDRMRLKGSKTKDETEEMKKIFPGERLNIILWNSNFAIHTLKTH